MSKQPSPTKIEFSLNTNEPNKLNSYSVSSSKYNKNGKCSQDLVEIQQATKRLDQKIDKEGVLVTFEDVS